MKGTQFLLKNLLASFVLVLVFAGLHTIPAQAAEQPAGHTASVSVNRASGECTYTIQGLDPLTTGTITLSVAHKDTKAVAFTKEIPLTTTNCVNGTLTGCFSLDLLNGEYDTYTVDIIIGNSTISAGTCDFTVHTDNISLSVKGNSSDAIRTAVITSAEPTGDVIIPGTGKQVAVYAWKEGADESTAKAVTANTSFTEGGMNLPMNLSETDSFYGNWKAKLVLLSTQTTKSTTLAVATYTVIPAHSKFIVKKTKSLEKKQSFRITLDGLKNVYGTSSVTFALTDSRGKNVLSVNGTKQSNGSKFNATVSMKQLKYKLDRYTITATLKDKQGKTYKFGTLAVADCTSQGGTLTVTRKTNATCVFKLANAYLPGNIKKASFVLYQKQGKKYTKIATYPVKKTANLSKITLRVANENTGDYKVCVYGYTSWNKKVFLNEETYQLNKKHMGKNGWFYEKYAGKTYKFYYVNNKKQIDLTKILNIKESNATNTNKFYIEINRAASAVTVFMYNKETKKYDLPIKTCSVSVGADTWTNAGTSKLNPDSSYTPLGTYSICTNGTSVKYSMKQMHEPDGKILYARWTSHIVGNVYFHSIAVASDSHYALNPYTYNRLGSPASAGCIRMTVADAKWLYDYASTGSIVKIVKGNAKKPGPLGKAPTIKVQGSINYDPTDPGVPDSRKKKDYKAKKISGYITKAGKRVGC